MTASPAYDRDAGKDTVTVEVNADLLARVRRYGDLSVQVEAALADYLTRRERVEARPPPTQEQIDRAIASTKRFIEEYGCPADEYNPF